MIESLEIYRDKIDQSKILNELVLKPKSYILATIHRQENTDSPIQIKKILDLLSGLSRNVKIILPLHPGTRKRITSYGLDELLNPFKVIEPLGYFDFMKLVKSSLGVVTDSGGIQEETSHLGVPCATLRDNTERPITLELGSNKLCPIEQTSSEEIFKHLNRSDFLPHNISLWDGHVSERIFKTLQTWFHR